MGSHTRRPRRGRPTWLSLSETQSLGGAISTDEARLVLRPERSQIEMKELPVEKFLMQWVTVF
jgi:hypothetical protein